MKVGLRFWANAPLAVAAVVSTVTGCKVRAGLAALVAWVVVAVGALVEPVVAVAGALVADGCSVGC